MVTIPWSDAAEEMTEQKQLVEKARLTLEAFAADPSMGGELGKLRSETKSLFMVPQFVRGAFVFGAAGGWGVLLV